MIHMSTEKEGGTIDFAKVILQRKKLLIAVLGLVLLIGAFFAFATKNVYVVDMLIEVGTYPGFEGALIPLENPHQLTEKISAGSYDEAVKSKLGLDAGKQLILKATNPDNTNLVRVYIQSSEPDTALPILEEVARLILADHDIRSSERGISNIVGFVPTDIAKVPTIASRPLNDRPILVMIFAAFVGVVFALLAVFSTEWWRRSLES
jgi:capsular polysaccharide biosynthesis protein